MIDFEIPANFRQLQGLVHQLAVSQLRPLAREYDTREHESPWDLIRLMAQFTRGGGIQKMASEGLVTDEPSGGRKDKGSKAPSMRAIMGAILAEEMFWGDAGLSLCLPNPGLGGGAIQATGTPAQKDKFLKRFGGEEPVWGAMAITEPHCGSDTSAIKTAAKRDGKSWVLNGEKIFVTGGKRALEDSKGFVVV